MGLSDIRNKRYLVPSIIIFLGLARFLSLIVVTCPNFMTSYERYILPILAILFIFALHKFVCYLEDNKKTIWGYYILALVLLLIVYIGIDVVLWRLLGECRSVPPF
ncbi:MAG: hypothetical protein CMH63_02500 [Nanoarchaeota archaeon]|jgi:hypothetical protein|nr:hypothetical protein [Nanoarchaeota archaeon]|tara:strand:- start:3625 stop:3942 length:318 start_codon:yes stop_codon:yes gene_type:complete